jgi:ribosomal protein S18 acetylase RimI-like enzyme
MSAESWEPFNSDPEGAAALLGDLESEARATGHQPEAERLASRRKSILEGKVDGGLLRDSRGRAMGLAIWEIVGALGRRVVWTHLRTESEGPAGWNRFLATLLDSPDPSGPVLLFASSIPGYPEPAAAEFLGPRGFHAFHRYGLEFPAGAPLPADSVQPLNVGRLRTVGPEDLEELAVLNAASYANSIDRFLFAAGDDPVEGARHLLRLVFGGEYGAFLRDASFGLDIDGQLRGATLVTDNSRYRLIADVEVHPSFQGQGHARRLLRATLAATTPDTTTPVVLSVTRENGVAFDFYRRLGFVVKEGPFTMWVNTDALGISPPDPEGNYRLEKAV